MLHVATRDKSDQRASSFGVILRQTWPLLNDSAFQQLLLKLVGDKEEVGVAKEIQNVLKHSLPQYQPRDERVRSYPYPRGSCFSRYRNNSVNPK